MPNIRRLNDDLQQSAIEELGEVPERISEDLKILKKWLALQPHLKANTNDQFLLAFLRGCKFSIEKAKLKIDKFYAIRTKFPSSFQAIDVDNKRFRNILQLGTFVYLPEPLHHNGPRIMMNRSGLCSPDEYKIEELFLVASALQEITLLEDDYAMVHGVIGIVDVGQITMGHLTQMTPMLMKRISVFSEDAVPLRMRATHFINATSIFEQFFNLMKPLMSAKQQQRLFVHGKDLDSLTSKIPLKFLPKEYGGKNGSIPEIIRTWDRKLDDYRDYFKANINYGTNEKLRPGKAINFDSLFGVEGTFRTLNID